MTEETTSKSEEAISGPQLNVMEEASLTNPRDIFLKNFRGRFYKGLDYLSLFLYALIVAVGAFLADFILIAVLEFLIASTISKYPVVAIAFDWFQIGSASLTLVTAFVFVLFSALSQMRFAYEVNIELEEQEQSA